MPKEFFDHLKPALFAILVAFLVCLVIAPLIIPMLRRLKFGQTVREDGPQSHLKKTGTPTMGGLAIWAALLLSVALVARDDTQLLASALLCAFGYGAIGFLDDFIKVKLKRNLGLNFWQKITGQVIFAFLLSYFAAKSPLVGTSWLLPWSGKTIELGWAFIPITMFLTVGFTNSINLIDGLDGLASSVTAVVSAACALVLAALSKNADLHGNIALAQNLTNLAMFAGAVCGACIGFLGVNKHPAKVFMGDTGSMFLGGAIVAMFVLSRSVLLLPMMGGMYLVTALSVMLQVGNYKLRKKRIFRMAPLHHHFELGGMHETKVVALYVIITVVLCILALLIAG